MPFCLIFLLNRRSALSKVSPSRTFTSDTVGTHLLSAGPAPPWRGASDSTLSPSPAAEERRRPARASRCRRGPEITQVAISSRSVAPSLTITSRPPLADRLHRHRRRGPDRQRRSHGEADVAAAAPPPSRASMSAATSGWPKLIVAVLSRPPQSSQCGSTSPSRTRSRAMSIGIRRPQSRHAASEEVPCSSITFTVPAF